jgi:hypothetical protein
MPSRDALHRLVEELPESEVQRAERVLDALKDAAEHEGPLYSLENAPADDEPETTAERAAVAEAWDEHRRDEGFSTEQLRRDLGLA